ncbi:MAG: hypothetical protein ACOC4A_02585 [Spirochaetota bacterium]
MPALLLSVFLVGGCELLSPEGPPLRYISVEVDADDAADEVAEEEAAAPAAAPSVEAPAATASEGTCGGELVLRVELENVTPVAVESFRATVYLYDPAQVIEWRNRIALPAGERREYCVDLAAAYHAVPTSPPTIDMLHIHEVTFEDGSEWRDPLAAYVWRRDATTPEVNS